LIGDQIEIDFWHTNLAGTLHVSLPTDIIQLFGTGSVPVLVGGTVLGVFELGERFASQQAKDALSKWLLTFDVQKAKALPNGTQELFERIFGKRHFSLKCFVRSAAFSLSAMAFMALLVFLIYPSEALEMKDQFFRGLYKYGDWLEFTVWLPWSILIDYVSLFKTRVILEVLTRMRRRTTLIAMAIIAIDYIVYAIPFGLGVALIMYITLAIDEAIPWSLVVFNNILMTSINATIGTFITFAYQFSYKLLLAISFWAGFAPSIWMWLYVLALFVTRGLLRSEKIVNWLRWFLDVEKNPFRSIGAVAATLAFIASVAIILVSVEVSRISAAS
jgi:hypothetical protein